MPAEIRGLTLAQPWPWAFPWKDVENRKWAPPDSMLGEWIALHGGRLPGRKMTDEQIHDWHFILHTMRVHRPEVFNGEMMRHAREKDWYRGIFGVARLVGWAGDSGVAQMLDTKIDTFAKHAQSPWAVGPWRWLLEDVVVFSPEHFVPRKGELGLWQLSSLELVQTRAGYELATGQEAPF